MIDLSVWTSFAGVVLGFAGAQVTQFRAERSARKREERTWEREDAARSYEHRRDAYVDFIKEYHRHWSRVAAVDWRYEPEPPEDWLESLYDRLVQIDIFGTKSAARLAKDAYDAMSTDGCSERGLGPDVLDPLTEQIRKDLTIDSGAKNGVKPTPL